MEVRIGDRLTDEQGEWAVDTHPIALHGGKALHARLRKVGEPVTVRYLLARAFAGGGSAATRDRLLTVAEAAARLSLSRHALYKRARTLPFAVRQGRALRFSEAGIDRYIAQQQRR
jgi:excisionase family DNA binding protein